MNRPHPLLAEAVAWFAVAVLAGTIAMLAGMILRPAFGFPGARLDPILARYKAAEINIIDLQPYAWYRGDGNALDASGNNRHAAWTGTEAYTNGIAGQALRFRSGEHLAFAVPSAVYSHHTHVNSWTVGFWFRFTASATAGSASGLYRAVDTDANVTRGTGIQINNQSFTGGTARRLRASFRSSTAESTAVENDTNIADETWTHVIMTHDATTGKFALWVDGQLQGEADSIEVAAQATGAVPAYRLRGTAVPLDGDIDELIFFDRAVDAAEIGILSKMESYE